MKNNHECLRFHLVFAAVCLLMPGCSHQTASEKSDSVFVAVAQYIDAYDRGNKAEIRRMIWGHGAPADLVDAYVDVACGWSGGNKVVSLSVEKFNAPVNPTQWKGKAIPPTEKPQWAVSIVTKGNMGFEGAESRAEIKLPFGQKGGRWGICIIGPEEHKGFKNTKIPDQTKDQSKETQLGPNKGDAARFP